MSNLKAKRLRNYPFEVVAAKAQPLQSWQFAKLHGDSAKEIVIIEIKRLECREVVDRRWDDISEVGVSDAECNHTPSRVAQNTMPMAHWMGAPITKGVVALETGFEGE